MDRETEKRRERQQKRKVKRQLEYHGLEQKKTKEQTNRTEEKTR